MGETKEPPPPLSALWSRARAWGRLGGATISLLGLQPLFAFGHHAVSLWRYVEHVDTARDIYSLFGGNLAMLMSIVTSPITGIVLILAGLIWIPAAKSEAEGSTVNILWAIGGWGVTIILASVMLASILVESYMNSYGESEFRRYYIEAHTNREITKTQQEGIRRFVCHSSEGFRSVIVVSVSGDEPTHYAKEFIDYFTKCGISVGGKSRVPGVPDFVESFPINSETADLNKKGLFVAVLDNDNPDKKSQEFLSDMKKAGFDIKFSRFEGDATEGIKKDPYDHVTLFVAHQQL